MAKAGVLQRQSGIGASPGRPVRVPNRGIIIMKIVVIVTAGLALLLGGCMHTSLPPVSDANFTARDKQQLANPPLSAGVDPTRLSASGRPIPPQRSARVYPGRYRWTLRLLRVA